jgi:DNA-binding transcriptional LysR family regulator
VSSPAPRPLQTLNLNLLVSLEALLRRRSVSRAAEELHLGQPSLSESLARLRRHFGDELLQRDGHDLVLTPFASGLVPQVTLALQAVQAVFDGNAVFDPARSSREFVISAADVLVNVIGPPLWQAVHRQAPGIRLDFRAPEAGLFSDPQSATRSLDFVICPHGLLTGISHQDLFPAVWVFVVAAANDQVGDTLTVADLQSLTWVTAFSFARAGQPSDINPVRDLRRAGIEPTIAISTESFLNVPQLVSGTRHLGVIHRSHANLVAAGLGLRVLDSPVPLSPLTQALWWNPVFDTDPGHRWLRGVLIQAVSE